MDGETDSGGRERGFVATLELDFHQRLMTRMPSEKDFGEQEVGFAIHLGAGKHPLQVGNGVGIPLAPRAFGPDEGNIGCGGMCGHGGAYQRIAAVFGYSRPFDEPTKLQAIVERGAHAPGRYEQKGQAPEHGKAHGQSTTSEAGSPGMAERSSHTPSSRVSPACPDEGDGGDGDTGHFQAEIDPVLQNEDEDSRDGSGSDGASRGAHAGRADQPGEKADGEEGDGCLFYTSDAADDLLRLDLGRRRTLQKKNH